MFTSTTWPLPVEARERSARMIAITQVRPPPAKSAAVRYAQGKYQGDFRVRKDSRSLFLESPVRDFSQVTY
jgi:hypothetical protein